MNKQPLAVTHPEIAPQWHPIKNGSLTPFDVLAGTHRKAWWRCLKGKDHVWEANINNRSKGVEVPCLSRSKGCKI